MNPFHPVHRDTRKPMFIAEDLQFASEYFWTIMRFNEPVKWQSAKTFAGAAANVAAKKALVRKRERRDLLEQYQMRCPDCGAVIPVMNRVDAFMQYEDHARSLSHMVIVHSRQALVAGWIPLTSTPNLKTDKLPTLATMIRHYLPDIAGWLQGRDALDDAPLKWSGTHHWIPLAQSWPVIGLMRSENTSTLEALQLAWDTPTSAPIAEQLHRWTHQASWFPWGDARAGGVKVSSISGQFQSEERIADHFAALIESEDTLWNEPSMDVRAAERRRMDAMEEAEFELADKGETP